MKEYRKIASLKFMYEINEYGEVRNIKSKKVLKWNIHYKNGRAAINVRINKVMFYPLVHRLVAETWLKDYDESLTVDHIDNNPLNNHVSNLQMMTLKDNYQKAVRDGQIKGNLIPQRKVIGVHKKTKEIKLFNGALEAATYIKETYPHYEGGMKNIRVRILTHCSGKRKGIAYNHKWSYHKPVETISQESRVVIDKQLEKDIA